MSTQLRLLDTTKHLQPEDNFPIFKFSSVGDAVEAKFVGRRKGVKTKQGDSVVLDVDILDSIVVGDKSVTGRYSIFESGHLGQIFDRENLQPADRFVLRLHSVNRQSRFKKFFFQKVDELSDEPADDEPEPPPEFFKRR